MHFCYILRIKVVQSLQWRSLSANDGSNWWFCTQRWSGSRWTIQSDRGYTVDCRTLHIQSKFIYGVACIIMLRRKRFCWNQLKTGGTELFTAIWWANWLSPDVMVRHELHRQQVYISVVRFFKDRVFRAPTMGPNNQFQCIFWPTGQFVCIQKRAELANLKGRAFHQKKRSLTEVWSPVNNGLVWIGWESLWRNL